MSLFKIVKQPTALVMDDPFQVLTQSTPTMRPMATRRPENMGVLALVAAVVVLSIGGYWWSTRHGQPTGERPYVYFEVRAIDSAGRPVSGARVESSGKAIGVTDSYGEWRRFMRVQLGKPLALTFARDLETSSLRATKTFAIPSSTPKDGEFEMKGTVALKSLPLIVGNTKGIPENTLEKADIAQRTKLLPSQAPQTTPAETSVSDQSIDSKSDPGSSMGAIKPVLIGPGSAAPLALAKSQHQQLARAISGELGARLREVGLAIDTKVGTPVTI